ncbi:hypothetical protein ACQPW1_22395 [Nocardia sp. CA-128927]|uniref:hypothetical protein n=1 Tax=Nocardia sp. CA-128927 TaxID=3239975 RepID=UPI003D95C24F
MNTAAIQMAVDAHGWRTQVPIPGICDIPFGPREACALRDLGTEAAGDAINSGFDDIVDKLVSGVAFVLRLALMWWLEFPSPQLTASTGEPGPVLTSIRGYTGGLQILLMTGGIMFAAARLAMSKRGGVAGEAQESFLVYGRAVFASMTFAAVITMGTRAGDAFSSWVIFDATHGDLNTAVARLTEFDLRSHTGLGSGVLLVIGILGLISLLVQLVMLVVRQALLILVVAAIPIAAAAAGTAPGGQAYKKMLAWSLAFVLWKPTGALVYAIAFTAAGTKTEGQQQDTQLVLLGLILLLMVPIVLPALMRLIAPAVATLGGGGGAAAALAGGAIGLATGSAGGGSDARKVSEGENAPSGGASPTGGQPSGGGGGGGGGGGRPLAGGTGGGASTGISASGGGGGNGGSPAGGGGTSGAAAAPAEAGGASAAGAQGGATAASAGGAGAAAGPVGAAVMGAQMAKNAAQQGISSIDAQGRDATDSGMEVNAPVPGEVRR